MMFLWNVHHGDHRVFSCFIKVVFIALWCNLNYLSLQVFWVREESLLVPFWSWPKRALKMCVELEAALPFWLKGLEREGLQGVCADFF